MRDQYQYHPAAVMLLILMLLPTVGCSAAKSDADVYYLYQLEEDGLSLEKEKLEVSGDSSGDVTAALMDEIAAADPEVLLPENVEILNYEIQDGILTIDFSAAYNEMDGVEELLCRAAVVETMLQSDSVDAVLFEVEGESLTDEDGIQIGRMTDETFITNPAGQINSTQKATVVLYFTDSTGQYLYPEQRTLHYFTSMSVEWMVVEHLIRGPQDASLSPTVPAETAIISVISADGICYVNLDQTFLATDFSVTGEITIWSIVNSLCELDGIESVQFTIDGVADIDYTETINLNQSFERNEDLIAENAEPIETEVEEELE